MGRGWHRTQGNQGRGRNSYQMCFRKRGCVAPQGTRHAVTAGRGGEPTDTCAKGVGRRFCIGFVLAKKPGQALGSDRAGSNAHHTQPTRVTSGSFPHTGKQQSRVGNGANATTSTDFREAE